MKIKGFDKDLKCRGMQFEIGKTYDTGFDKDLELCSEKVFHYCDNLRSVNTFYNCSPAEGNRYCEIEVLGEEIRDNEKCGSNKIKIIREIVGEELDILRGIYNGNVGIFNTDDFNTGNFNTGNRNTGNRNTGNRNTGNFNTGDRNTGDFNTDDFNTGNFNTGNRNTGNRNTGSFNTGNRNTDDCNTGNCNTGSFNTGNRNTGSFNTGDRNTGDFNTDYFNTGNRNTGSFNTGNRNTGDFNTGDFNTGNRNTGIFNSCDYSNGVFCTEEPTIKIFNVDSGMTMREFLNSEFYEAITSSGFVLTELVNGELVKHTYKEACKKWWDNMSDENRKIIKSMPNFNAEIFEEITGIEVE